MAKKKTLEESLIESSLLTPAQLKEAQTEQITSGQPLTTVLVNKGFITEEHLVIFISDTFNLPRIDLSNYMINPKIIELVPEDLARKYELIPVLKIGNRLSCAMVDPWNVFALDELKMKTNFLIEPAIAGRAEIRKALDAYYGEKGSLEELITIIEKGELSLPEMKDGKEVSLKSLEEIVKEPIVVKLVNLLIMKAVRERASDIHIEPEKEELKTRLRVDGLLSQIKSPPKYLQPAIISRIKILAGLNIAERRIPQDGRFSQKIEGREIDFRVSCVPTIHGENVVLRLLDQSSLYYSLEKIGFSRENLIKFQKLLTKSYGIILVTGPTGSGKSTTLYGSLDKINTVEKNIITIEDPVEYRLQGIRQIQVNPKIGLTFASGLRSILRQDPDVVMVGEIRDYETAEIAIHASLTGHLIFSTLHTNDAPGALPRLIDMGVEPFLLSSSILAILAQRLVRTICSACKKSYSPPPEILAELGLEKEKELVFYKGTGCPKCLNSGYKGRIAIFELMIMDEKIRTLVNTKASSDQIKKAALDSGMITLRMDGLEKVKTGVTTLEEVLRVTQEA